MNEYATVLVNKGFRSERMDYEKAVAYGLLLVELGNENVEVEVFRVEQIQGKEDVNGRHSVRQLIRSKVFPIPQKRTRKRKHTRI